MKIKTDVRIKGSKKGGWVIQVYDSPDSFQDIAITHEEAKRLRDILIQKTK